MKLTINKLYIYSKTNNLPLLGNENYDFWLPYVNNNAVFDRFFRDKFLSWFYWLDFPDGSATADIYNDFVEAIASHLSINAKRYSELYRVQILAANAYDIVNNYDLTETHTNIHSNTSSDTYGERTDTNTSASTEGAREDSTSTTTTDGARSDSGSTTVGVATNTSEKEIAGFNSSDYTDADKQTDIFGSHTDTTSVSKGEQVNTNDTTLNKGTQSNSSSGSTVKGSETDSHTASGTETINIRRSGNIGVQTAADVIGGHIELWDSFNFYGKIFNEIAKEYLLLDNDYAFESYSGGSGGASDEQVLTAIADLSAKVTAGFEAGAKSSQISGLATTSQLNNVEGNIREDIANVYSEVSDIDTTTNSIALDVSALRASSNSIALDVSALRASSLVYKNEIIGSIEGVTNDEY